MSAHQTERETLFAAMKATKDKRMYERYQTIYFYLQGYSRKKIVNMVGRSEKTIYNYVNAYKEKGLDGLTMGQSPGAPRKLTSEQEQELVQVIATKLPIDVGFPAKHNWTLAIIASFIKREWGQTYTLRGVSRLLYEDLGLSYTKPTYTLAKADGEKQKEFIEKTFPAIKKIVNEEIAHLLFQDESMIRDYQALQHTWFLKGKQRIIPTYGKHQGVKLIGTLNYETGDLFCVEEERYDAEAFLRFLQNVLERYPTGKIVMILDNARIHHAKLIQPFLSKNQQRLELVFLPPYSPELNLIEGLWKWLKSDVIYNVFYSSAKEIRKNVQAFIRELNRTPETVINRLCIRL
ncbi:IS630 family transposase [Bacillus cytotoxicus]|uniref:IS630 family transposase n=1 Tax=Bacillus cytotoxicus TaxID=580165 RepID=A0ACC6A8U7_9BACI|nr:IS630 family transposase [Bacillus cytotoxicus]